MKIIKETLWFLSAMVGWAVILITAGVVLRINWELFMLGWSAL